MINRILFKIVIILIIIVLSSCENIYFSNVLAKVTIGQTINEINSIISFEKNDTFSITYNNHNYFVVILKINNYYFSKENKYTFNDDNYYKYVGQVKDSIALKQIEMEKKNQVNSNINNNRQSRRGRIIPSLANKEVNENSKNRYQGQYEMFMNDNYFLIFNENKLENMGYLFEFKNSSFVSDNELAKELHNGYKKYLTLRGYSIDELQNN